jgi:hypothetical protein
LSWGQSQQRLSRPDYGYIEKVTKDKKQNAYYPTLLKRYMNNDTSLSREEMQLLYYGKFFQDGMSSINRDRDLDDSVKAVYKKDTLTKKDYEKLLTLFLKMQKSKPLDLATLYRLMSVCYKLNDPRGAVYEYYLTNLMGVIVSTGDGKTEETAFHIGSVSDEYTFLNLAGLDFGGSQSLIHSCDYLTVAENKYDLKGIYFNIEQILMEERRLFGIDDMVKKAMKDMENEEKKEKKESKK